MQSVLKLVVIDGPGVMDRILGVIRRFGCNISCIAAGEVEEGVSEITIAFHTKDVDVETMGKRLSALDCLRSWEEGREESDVLRELVLVKLRREQREQLEQIGMEGIHVLTEDDGSIYFEYSGSPSQVDEILHKLRKMKFTFTRTGPICLTKTPDQAGAR